MPDILVANRQDDEPLIQKTNQILAAVSYKVALVPLKFTFSG